MELAVAPLVYRIEKGIPSVTLATAGPSDGNGLPHESHLCLNLDKFVFAGVVSYTENSEVPVFQEDLDRFV